MAAHCSSFTRNNGKDAAEKFPGNRRCGFRCGKAGMGGEFYSGRAPVCCCPRSGGGHHKLRSHVDIDHLSGWRCATEHRRLRRRGDSRGARWPGAGPAKACTRRHDEALRCVSGSEGVAANSAGYEHRSSPRVEFANLFCTGWSASLGGNQPCAWRCFSQTARSGRYSQLDIGLRTDTHRYGCKRSGVGSRRRHEFRWREIAGCAQYRPRSRRVCTLGLLASSGFRALSLACDLSSAFPCQF